MAFLNILLLILNILGFTILGILGLILLITLVVLFVPVRYRGSGHFSDDPEVTDKIGFKARITWLLHFLSITYTYGEEEPLSVKILGFNLMKKKDKKPPKVKKEKKKRKSDEDIPENFDEEPEEPETEKAEEIKPAPQTVTIEDEPVPVAPEPESEPEPDTEPEPEPSKKTTHKDKKYGKMNKYVEIFKTDEFKSAFSLCKDGLISILKSILPRRWNVEASLGFDDPATLGTVLGINGIFYSILHRHLTIIPYWDREIIDISGELKGHITTGKLLFTAIRVYFNKNMRKILKMFKEAQ